MYLIKIAYSFFDFSNFNALCNKKKSLDKKLNNKYDMTVLAFLVLSNGL